MKFCQLLSLLPVFPLSQAAETVLGVYIFSRHGDRTSKSTPPADLTDLGYRQIFNSGTYYRNRYVSSSANKRIAGLNADVVKLSEISASAPVDNVLMNAAQGFLQGLYPPVGATPQQETLRNGSVVEIPLNGYQLIPLQTVTSGAKSEDTAWLQGASNCANALISSNAYRTSQEYMSLADSTLDFYKSLTPALNTTFSPDEISFKSAYTIFDYLNVAEIHNATFPSSSLITNSTLDQLRALANIHEYNLAYNNTDTIRAIAGATLAAEIVEALNTTVRSAGNAGKMYIQFGAYASFLSFFGLANLTATNADFFGIPDYTSAMTFELFTTAAPTPFPSAQDLQVRFLFHNGTSSTASDPTAYPLFGGQATEMSWDDFTAGMNRIAIGTQAHWCSACGNSTGVCASGAGAASASRAEGSNTGDGGPSKVVAGVIGAMVTLAVILGVEAVVMSLAGLRLVRKIRMREVAEGKNAAPQA
ncbi:MAG: hypothetical protein Q9163_001259 [Psora crenata]